MNTGKHPSAKQKEHKQPINKVRELSHAVSCATTHDAAQTARDARRLTGTFHPSTAGPPPATGAATSCLSPLALPASFLAPPTAVFLGLRRPSQA